MKPTTDAVARIIFDGIVNLGGPIAEWNEGSKLNDLQGPPILEFLNPYDTEDLTTTNGDYYQKPLMNYPRNYVVKKDMECPPQCSSVYPAHLSSCNNDTCEGCNPSRCTD